MTASTKTITNAEARVWLTEKAAKLTEQGKQLPEGVSLPSGRGRLSNASREYVEKTRRVTVVAANPGGSVPSNGLKAKLAAAAKDGKLPEGVTFKAGRGRLSKAAKQFAETL